MDQNPSRCPKIRYRERIWSRFGLFGETHRQFEDEDDDEDEYDLVCERTPTRSNARATVDPTHIYFVIIFFGVARTHTCG